MVYKAHHVSLTVMSANLNFPRSGAPVLVSDPAVTNAQRTYVVRTLGCQMNVLDSELVVGSLRRHGYELARTPAEADVIFFNTCSVRQKAEDRVFGLNRKLEELKNKKALS